MLLLELKVMYNHTGVVSGNHLGHSFEQHEPTGQIVANKKNVLSTPFNKDEIDIFKSRHKNYIREIEGYDHDIKKYYKIEHTHPTIMLSNLQNYNPTIGITYFEPHATDKLIHHHESKPRYDKEYVYNMHIPQQLEAMRVNNPADHKPLEHSHKLKVRNRF